VSLRAVVGRRVFFAATFRSFVPKSVLKPAVTELTSLYCRWFYPNQLNFSLFIKKNSVYNWKKLVGDPGLTYRGLYLAPFSVSCYTSWFFSLLVHSSRNDMCPTLASVICLSNVANKTRPLTSKKLPRIISKTKGELMSKVQACQFLFQLHLRWKKVLFHRRWFLALANIAISITKHRAEIRQKLCCVYTPVFNFIAEVLDTRAFFHHFVTVFVKKHCKHLCILACIQSECVAI